jgi:CheY-like chemotaxis protein
VPDSKTTSLTADQSNARQISATHRILVVDDNVDSANSLAELLSLSGHEVITAYGAISAFETAANFRPRVILLDIGLPGMSGYDVARHFRNQPETSAAMLVALTGYGQEDDRRKTREAGFDHHFIKPIDPGALFFAISAGSGVAQHCTLLMVHGSHGSRTTNVLRCLR